MTFNDILVKIDDVVWGIPTIVLILFTGLLLTIRCRGIQFTKLGRAFKQIFYAHFSFPGRRSMRPIYRLNFAILLAFCRYKSLQR